MLHVELRVTSDGSVICILEPAVEFKEVAVVNLNVYEVTDDTTKFKAVTDPAVIVPGSQVDAGIMMPEVYCVTMRVKPGSFDKVI